MRSIRVEPTECERAKSAGDARNDSTDFSRSIRVVEARVTTRRRIETRRFVREIRVSRALDGCVAVAAFSFSVDVIDCFLCGIFLVGVDE